MSAAVRVRGMKRRFGRQVALGGVDVDVAPGSFCVLLGPSGCGKTTLLRLIAGLEAPDEGRIEIDGRCVVDASSGRTVPAGRRKLGMVFQGYALWPHKTAAENIDWPLRIAGLDRAARRARLAELAALLDLAPHLERYPGELSGGQQQRVAIARCLGPRPRLLLFDEPLSNLDVQLRAEMRLELLRLHGETGVTIVYVTHDQSEALALADHLVVLRDGRVEQAGVPSTLLTRPHTAFVAGFLGVPPANLLTAAHQDGAWRIGGKAFAVGCAAWGDGPVQVMIRPERLRLHERPAAGLLQAVVVEATPLGERTLARVEGAFGRATVLMPPWVGGSHGALAYLALPPTPDAVFAADGGRIT